MDRTYAGDLYFTVGQDGLLAAANVLSAEQLLEGSYLLNCIRAHL